MKIIQALAKVIVILLLILFILAILFWKVPFGVYPFGPTEQKTVTVSRTYVDHDKEQSHYMVATDKGVFEVDNSWYTGVANADEIFAKFKDGHTYVITTKGNKVVNYFVQEYQYITDAVEVQNK